MEEETTQTQGATEGFQEYETSKNRLTFSRGQGLSQGLLKYKSMKIMLALYIKKYVYSV